MKPEIQRPLDLLQGQISAHDMKLSVSAAAIAANSGSVASALTGLSSSLAAIPTTGRHLATQTFSAAMSGTYTPTVGTNRVWIRVCGGGGGAAGANGNSSDGSGGAAGGYLEAWIDPGVSITGGLIVVGPGGLGTNGSSGGAAGSASSIVIQGVSYAVGGGSGGPAMGAGTGAFVGLIAAGGSTFGLGDVSVSGAPGCPGIRIGSDIGVGGNGGPGPFGGGGTGASATGNGGNGQFGSGGGGAASASASSFNGGNGGNGFVVVHEYS